MILVDTSAWIAFFRGARPVCDQVDRLLESGEVALCGPVVAELGRGFVSKRERDRVLDLLSACPVLHPPDELWREAGDLGFALRRRGLTAKTFDLLIATYALAHGTPLLTLDRDFAAMRRAGVPLDLA